MEIQDYIDFLEEKIAEGYDPEDDEAVILKQQACTLAFGDGVSGVADADIIAKLKTML